MSFLGNQLPKGAKPYGTSSTFICKGCSKCLRSQSSLNSHEKICPNLKMGRNLKSFFEGDPLQPPTSVEEGATKVVPLSQPLNHAIISTTMEQDEIATPNVNIGEHEEVASACEGVSASNSQHGSSQQNMPHSSAAENCNCPICNCPICKITVTEEVNSICCTMCSTWIHQTCLHMDDEEFNQLSQPDAVWFCARCRLIKSNKIKWGDLSGEVNIRDFVKSMYATIIGWKKNIFRLPRGKCGSDFIDELTRLINLFVNKTQWKRLALPIAHIFIPLMLQKPSSK